MNIKTKYKVGDTVWYISKTEKPIKIPCEECEGAGYFLTISNKEISCCDCRGLGHSVGYIEELTPISMYIRKIKVRVTDTVMIDYYEKEETTYGHIIEESKTYSSEKECRIACEKYKEGA